MGRRIQVSRVRERAGGAVEVVVFGHLSDAQHLREAVNGRSGVRTTEPKPVSTIPGVLISFRAKGTATKPLTRDKVLRLLKGDTFIELLQHVRGMYRIPMILNDQGLNVTLERIQRFQAQVAHLR